MDWKTLFAPPADCECQDCNSIFSPASYLVDVMQYLDNCPSNGAGSLSVLQILFKRRPDIGNLLLTCENTNTDIPYIDLVNEIMEYYVVNYSGQLPSPTIPPDPNLAHDTGRATAEALNAEPQFTLIDAYKTIYQRVYPFNLPYHQPLDVIRTYLDYLRTSRAELFEVFQRYPAKDNSTPPNIVLTPIPAVALDAEQMQLSLVEYEILTNSDFSGNPSALQPNVEGYFGDPPPQYIGKGILVSDLLQRTGLQYSDLLAILETRFINPGQDALNVLQRLIDQVPSVQAQALYNELKGNTWQTDNVFTGLLSANGVSNAQFTQWLADNFQNFQRVATLYESASDCDLSKTFIYSIQCLYETPPGDNLTPVADGNITAAFLSRFHRFIRLWRRTGWTIHELDNIISALGETDINPSLIHKLAGAKKVNGSLDIPLLQLACLWGNIDTYGHNSPNLFGRSLYAQLFLSTTGNTAGGGVQSQSVFAPNLLDGILSSAPTPQLADHLPEIFAGLAISGGDYEAIIADAHPANGDVSLLNLSLLYRYKLLAGALDLTISDLCTLKSCFNSQPFAGPADTFDFVQKVQNFQDSDFSVRGLNYILTGEFKNIDGIGLTQDTILGALPSLRGGLGKNSAPPTQLDQRQVISAIASLIGVDSSTARSVIGADANSILTAVTQTGLDAYYFNNVAWTDPPALQRTDLELNFSWGTGAPDSTVPADKFSVRWRGWICPPADGDYTFTIQVTETDESAAIWINNTRLFALNRSDLTDTQSGTSGQGTVSLKGGKLYSIQIEYAEITDTAGIQLLWQWADMSQATIDAGFLYPDTSVQTLLEKISLYHRASQLINGFRLSAAEVSYLISNPADFSGLNLLAITAEHWLRMYDYTQLRRTIPAKLLLSIFEAAAREDKASPGSLPSDNLVLTIANSNKPDWNKDYLSYLAGNRDTVPSPTPSYFQYKVGDFRNETALLRIKKAMDLATKTKMPINALGLPAWTTIEADLNGSVDSLHAVAEQIKNAVKGKYKDEWLTIATQLNNGIRENQKQALISYLLTLNLVAPDGDGNVTDADGLYEYLLLDVEMTSAVPTSRLIQATMAVQLFADRCLLGLEIQVKPDPINNRPPIDPNEWDWMKHYAVAAGLKKLFVYVENYLHPSLRDDKSAFFKDFESALKKSDITAENVENAFRDYLYKLDEVSNMEMCGLYHDIATQTLHVFGRTHSAPYNYYYRTASAGAQENSWTWSPWEQVQSDIKSIDDGENSGVHLMPVIWKKRLFLFWPEFAEKTAQSVNASQTFKALGDTSPDNNAPAKYWEVRLAWSEYANGKWTPKKLSKEILTPFGGALLRFIPERLEPTKPRQYFLRSAVDDNDALNITLLIRYIGQLTWPALAGLKDDAVPLGTFQISHIHDKIYATESSIEKTYTILLIYSYQRQDETSLLSPGFYQPFFESLVEQNKLSIAGSDFLQAAIQHKILFSNDVSIPTFETILTHPFFYTDIDNNRTYFATPVTKRRSLPPPGPNPPFVVFKDATRSPLVMFSQMASTQSHQPPVVRVATSSSSVQPLGVNLSAGIASPMTMPVNNLDSFRNNQDVIANGIGKGVPRGYPQDVVTYQPPFAGGWTKPWPPALFDHHGLAFYTFYHPFASILVKKLNQGGIAALLGADTAAFPEDSNFPLIDNSPNTINADDQGHTFANAYNPNFLNVRQYYPSDANRNYYLANVDFSKYGTYSCYNWELFFHSPLLIATSLSKNGKYAEARQWFHYIFNPLSTETADPQGSNSPFWEVLPFKTALDQEIQSYIAGLQPGYDIDPTTPTNPDSNQQIDQWRADPFNAFEIARLRPIAFMKNVVMCYLDNLISWGDDLFRTYTRENINEATQLYIMAARILGPAPQYIPGRGLVQNYSYNDLKNIGLNDFGDALVQLENMFPNSSDVQQTDTSVPQSLLGIGKTLYFCVPPNDHLLQYWRKVGDRLFNIRHGKNIDGVVRPLPLYEPPIDPELLLQAKAQGLDVAAILADSETPAPLYRFMYLLQKAKEFCNEVVSLGSALLSANEKQDAEELSRLRQTQEIDLLNKVTEVKGRQVLEAQANLDNLNSSRTTAIQRFRHYVEELLGNQPAQILDAPVLSPDLSDASSLPGETIINQVTSSVDVSLTGTDESGVNVIPKEKQEMDYEEAAQYTQLGGNALETLAAIFHLLPDFGVMMAPFGTGVDSKMTGGQQIGDSTSAGARALLGLSSFLSAQAGSSSRMAAFIRREQDWVFQANTAARDIIQLDKQIIAAKIRLQMAEHELTNHQQQIQSAQDIEQFLETKFSKQELYQWMIDKLQDAHKQGYQLAYEMARKAEKAYRFELGLPDTNFIQYGYYNDAYLGATAAEQLQLALKQMDAAYVENNVREFELAKHFSLLQLNPLGLLQLKETGTCSFDLPEAFFDMDYPGHYFRRIKSVGITIPCVAGPYTTVNSTLRLTQNSIRIDPSTSQGYPQKATSDVRFVANNIPFIKMATSSAQNDSGVFELNFHDERYLPFEGAGVISSWQLELNGKYLNNDTVTDFSQFDYDTITDVVIHIKYTAREEEMNSDLKQAAIDNLPPKSSVQMFSLRHDFPTQWQAFLNQPDPNTGDQTCQLQIDANRLSYFVSKSNPKITNIALYAEAPAPLPTLHITSPAPGNKTNDAFSFGPDPSFGALQVSNPAAQSWGDNNLGLWKMVKPGSPPLSANDVRDIYFLVSYALG